MLDGVYKQYLLLKEQYVAMRSAIGPLRISKSELFVLFLRKSWLDIKYNWTVSSNITRCGILITVLLICTYIADKAHHRLSSVSRRCGIPVLKLPKGVRRWDYPAILAEGARRYPNSPYIINYSGYEYIVYPASDFDEVKRLSLAQASLMEWFAKVFFQGWHLLGKDVSALHKVIGVELTRSLPYKVPERQDHVRMAFDRIIGRCPEWKSIPLYLTIQDIVTTSNATSLVGPKLGNERKWTNSVQRFGICIMLAVFFLHGVPRFLRRLLSVLAFLPTWGYYWYMKRLLHPMIQADYMEYQSKGETDISLSIDAPGRRFPITAWLMSRYTPEERHVDQISHDYIVASFESTASTSATLYFLLAELVARETLVQHLWEEVTQVSAADGTLPKTYLTELRKMDSFMRESSRVNVFNHLSLFRRVLQPVKLSSGPKLPVGSLICVDAYHITNSTELWGNPDEFDAMRFHKLREQPDHENRHQFTSLDSDSPGWGGGVQGCPGRVFASITIKIILAHILSNYEIKLPPGKGKPSRGNMPNGSVSPNMFAHILIRERKEKMK